MGRGILHRLLIGMGAVLLSANVYATESAVTESAVTESATRKVQEEQTEEEMDETGRVEKEVLRVKPDVAESPHMYRKWARISSEWQEIFENTEQYPEVLLENLKRNPETLDFVYGYPEASTEPAGSMSISEKLMKCPLFIQWDPRWGYVSYGSYNIGVSGCGPTCLSMILYSFLQDETLTPPALAKAATDGGYYYAGQGTAWTYLVEVPRKYGLEVQQSVTLDEAAMQECLENGGLMICSMSPGDFTDTGHFIVVCGYKDGEFTVNDPFSYKNSYKTWDYETLIGQTKQIWRYRYKEEVDFTDVV